MSIHLLYLIISLKNAYLYKKNIIRIIFNKKFYSILNLLYKENIILSYTLDGIYVNLYITNSLEIGKRLKLISSRHNLNTLKYLSLCKLVYDVNFFLIASTNKGLLNNLNLKKYKIGGILLITG